MADSVKALMAVLVVGCCLTALLSFSQTHGMLAASAAAGGAGNIATAQPAVDRALAARLQEFPDAVKTLETRLLELERSIQELASPPSDAAAALLAAAQAGAPPPAGGDAAAALAPGGRFRQDKKCGKNSKLRLPGGGPVECDPQGDYPCCSALGWCGDSAEHCSCTGCVDYRAAGATAATASDDGGADRRRRAADAAKVSPASTLLHHGRSSRDQAGDSTVIVVIPFRDREGHLVKFKQYWRWFAKEGNHPRKVAKWEVYVIEQFDSETFNRGWNFNVGLAIASAQASASPDITPDMEISGFSCAVIQDVDYLPEKGVDYSDCKVPMQLSAEIDRYHWKTPYLTSAGGIVGMSLVHWRQINGFGNDYFGWGGEDDELHHRLRLNNLLHGDCYPFCKNNNDPDIGKKGISIKRPRKGHGRFSGKYMHSANHTKRITDSKAYARNVKMLQEIEGGSDRWKRDGLSNLGFRILYRDIDTADAAEGVTYHHIKVHRGQDSFDLRRIQLAVPLDLCEKGGAAAAGTWSIQALGERVPWDIAELRTLATSMLGQAGGTCTSFTAKSLSFILIDRRRNLAKILSDGDPRLLIVFYRSLRKPQEDGLIVADARARDELQKALAQAGAFAVPPSELSVCTSSLKKGGPKYSVHQGSACSGGGWESLKHGYFRAYAKPRNGFVAVTFCDNEKYWIQRIVKGESCEKKWAGLKWVHGGTFWAARGSEFCVGTRQSSAEELSFSRLLAKENCADGDGYRQDFNFAGVKEHLALTATMVCIGRSSSGQARVSQGAEGCDEDGFEEVARFAARRGAAAAGVDQRFCVVRDAGGGGDAIREGGSCGDEQKFEFAVPARAAGSGRTQICASKGGTRIEVAGSSPCRGDISFQAPSAADVAASTPRGGGSASDGPLYTLVEEEVPCFGFVCASVVKAVTAS